VREEQNWKPARRRYLLFDNSSSFVVVANQEEQYSIWPLDRELPQGWREAGASGSRDECLDYIERTWTDMRPLSLRKKMDAPAEAEV
jgi:MbtH protein